MILDSLQRRALNALLGMQRQSWEQGLLGQALLDLEQWELAEVVARDAVARQSRDGRLASTGHDGSVNSAAASEVVAWASVREPSLRNAFGQQLGWLLQGAPRAADGTLFHFTEGSEVWVDSVYMVLPVLVLANEEGAALAQFRGHRERLFDVGSGLWGSRFDEDGSRLIQSSHWGTGNGWVVAGIARAITLGLRSAELADHAQTVIDALLALRHEDGSFTNIVDDPATFEENTVGLMLAYATFTGVADGWLPTSYLDVARSLLAHGRSLVDANGLVQRVCGSPEFESQGSSPEAQAFFLLASAASARAS